MASRTDCYCGVCRGGESKVFHTCVRDAAMTVVLATLTAATGGHVGQGEYAAAHDERPARAIVISTLHIQGLCSVGALDEKCRRYDLHPVLSAVRAGLAHSLPAMISVADDNTHCETKYIGECCMYMSYL